ncbi:MAG TPA: hydrogenase iron-sulfur subunit [Atribacteraceae bacterium]|nr:hydrogenase iron-sulfur subunit [Atribacteraceae bacterium]
MKIIAVACDKSGVAAVLRAREGLLRDGVTVDLIPIPCLGTIRESQLLEFLEEEIDALLLAGCPLDSCHNLEGSRYARDRAHRVNALLREAEVSKRVLTAFVTAEKTGEIRRIIKDFT